MTEMTLAAVRAIVSRALRVTRTDEQLVSELSLFTGEAGHEPLQVDRRLCLSDSHALRKHRS